MKGVFRLAPLPRILLSATAAIVLTLGCNDEPFAPFQDATTSYPYDRAQLAALTSHGEGCVVSTYNGDSVARGFVMARKDLPFHLPAIQRQPLTGLGNGYPRRIIVQGQGKPIALECWLPSNLTAQQVGEAVRSSMSDGRWTAIAASLEEARIIPARGERIATPEGLEFERQMLETSPLRRGPAREARAECGGPMSDRGTRPSFECYEECYDWEATIYFNGDSWSITITGYGCIVTDTGGALTWMISNGWWQYCGGNVPDWRDNIIGEYRNPLFFNSTYRPQCDDFVTDISSTRFAWPQLQVSLLHTDTEGAKRGLFRSEMLQGIDSLQGAWGLNDPLHLNSVYRCPHKNYSLVHAASHGRHMYGDAVDIGTTQATWQSLWNVASTIPGAHALTAAQDPNCSELCVHVDWRP
jgi:hypothetical protein